MKPVAAFVERVLRQRRPKPFRAGPGDAEVMRIAVELAAAGRPAAEPSAAFVERLRGELAGQLEPPGGAAPAGGLAPAGHPSAGVLATRRGVVWAAGIAAAAGGVGFAGGTALTGGSVAASGAGDARSTGGSQVLRPAEPGTWQTVSTSQELPDGGVRAFETPVVFGFVGRANGQLFAVSGACTHLGCKLALNRPARELQCPCHTAAFTLTGAVVHHPRLGPLPPLPRLPVREAGGVVQVLAATPLTSPPPGGAAS
jgi:cytochrome b6-f complex iron-sulfur subunit